MTWQTEYPTLATVKAAHSTTLQTWDDNLPPPQTDVERTVRKRISKLLFEKAAEEVREKEPDIADKWNEISDLAKKMGLGDLGRM